ncbi:hypothetical protein Anas_07604 [Armadillidium nasatum]|uniref:Uncharacterized protein n=1 Tax=Armadillidium nasatum TaxID=96803 RepID=A0A5N5T8K9_9CRUS|nr:hypothetical protein Anas_07604 [Armadillidium nasatum]
MLLLKDLQYQRNLLKKKKGWFDSLVSWMNDLIIGCKICLFKSFSHSPENCSNEVLHKDGNPAQLPESSASSPQTELETSEFKTQVLQSGKQTRPPNLDKLTENEQIKVDQSEIGVKLKPSLGNYHSFSFVVHFKYITSEKFSTLKIWKTSQQQ